MYLMPKKVNDIRLLLIQARDTQDIEYQEQSCFVERCRISYSQLVHVNVIRDELNPGLFSEVDVMMIGGAGEFSAVNDYPWMPSLLELVRHAHEENLPTFGSCWGHQIIARALGGTVIHDSARAELGCHPVVLTEAGKNDELFRDFPTTFLANMGHHDRVVELPDQGVELAFNDTQPNEAFRIAGKPMYGTQFHSELDAHRERERLLRYREEYRKEIPTEEAFQAILHSLADTTDVDHLLFDFINKFVISSSLSYSLRLSHSHWGYGCLISP